MVRFHYCCVISANLGSDEGQGGHTSCQTGVGVGGAGSDYLPDRRGEGMYGPDARRQQPSPRGICLFQDASGGVISI